MERIWITFLFFSSQSINIANKNKILIKIYEISHHLPKKAISVRVVNFPKAVIFLLFSREMHVPFSEAELANFYTRLSERTMFSPPALIIFRAMPFRHFDAGIEKWRQIHNVFMENQLLHWKKSYVAFLYWLLAFPFYFANIQRKYI